MTDLVLRDVTPRDIDALLDALEHCLKNGCTSHPAQLIAIRRKIRDDAERIVNEGGDDPAGHTD